MGNIIIHSEFGKKLIELTEDELIIKRFLHRKRVKRINIRSAYMWGNTLNILTYDNKCIYAYYMFINGSEVENIKRIIDEVNKEDIIFNLNKDTFPLWLIFFYFFPSTNALMEDWKRGRYFSWIWAIVIIAFLLSSYMKRIRNKGINYSIENREFKWIRRLGESTTHYPVEDIRLIKDDGPILKCKFHNEKDTFKMVKKIDYPLSYRFALEEIGNIASGKSSLEKL